MNQEVNVVARLDVSTKKHPSAVMLIDQDDLLMLRSMGVGKMYAHRNRPTSSLYAFCKFKGKKHAVHNLLTKGWALVDHENHNGLDNRRLNLRRCTTSQNCMNRVVNSNSTSGVTGVHWLKRNQKWTAYITPEGKRIYLGIFDDFFEAICARKSAEITYFGEYATT